MQIDHRIDGDQGKFTAIAEGVQAGVLMYTPIAADHFSIDHVIVEKAFGGQGIGKKLVMAAIDYARVNGFKIKPVCSFAATFMAKSVDDQDLLIA